jgi:hypothetical protein
MTLKETILSYCVAALIFTWVVVGYAFWTRIDNAERKIAALEAESRPLIVVDRYSSVYLATEGVKPEKPGEDEQWARLY